MAIANSVTGVQGGQRTSILDWLQVAVVNLYSLKGYVVAFVVICVMLRFEILCQMERNHSAFRRRILNVVA